MAAQALPRTSLGELIELSQMKCEHKIIFQRLDATDRNYSEAVTEVFLKCADMGEEDQSDRTGNREVPQWCNFELCSAPQANQNWPNTRTLLPSMF